MSTVQAHIEVLKAAMIEVTAAHGGWLIASSPENTAILRAQLYAAVEAAARLGAMFELASPAVTSDEGIEIILECEPEIESIRGNVQASGDDAADRAAEEEVRRQLDAGNEWAWCSVKVTARRGGLEGVDHLGGCSYRSEAEFRADGYFADMVKVAKDDLRRVESEARAARGAFPVFAEHADARCTDSHGPLVGHRESGFPVGRGAHRGECPRCHRSTFYDLRADHPTPLIYPAEVSP